MLVALPGTGSKPGQQCEVFLAADFFALAGAVFSALACAFAAVLRVLALVVRLLAVVERLVPEDFDAEADRLVVAML